MLEEVYENVSETLRKADAIIVTSGAGMGVDSGLPDFRGDEGFWRAYPPYERLNISFPDAANPQHFGDDPAFGWGFYGHRTNLYRSTVPHAGFGIILSWIDRLGLDWFAVTSNVDGQFQKAGFARDRILEVHGSIHHLQCTGPCNSTIRDNHETFEIDLDTMRSKQVPRCPDCGAVARPNILMFGDWSWLGHRTEAQGRRFDGFLSNHGDSRLVVLEMGAGTGIPTIRHLGERVCARRDALLVRINPREPQVGGSHASLPVGALEGLRGIDGALQGD